MLNYMEIIKDGESETVEFKKSTGTLREAVETICAFANLRGGRLFIGINDDGKIVGQTISDDTLKNLSNTIQLNSEPKLYPLIEKVNIDNRSCIVVTVEESPLKPHVAYGRPFIRMGPTTRKLSREQYELMLQQRMNGYAFDYQACKKAAIEDIAPDKVYEFIETANALRNLNENIYLPIDTILTKLGLMLDNGALTRAAVLLFGKNPNHFFEGFFEIKAGDFPDANGYDVLTNNQEFNGTLIENFHTSLSFILKSIRYHSRKDGLVRSQDYDLPVEAIREALVNMIVHRDYRHQIKSTIEVRPANVVFYNPAQLFGPTITIDSLTRRHPSRPGNKLIAKIFYLMGLFENWGGGTLKICEAAASHNLLPPVFSYTDGMFTLELSRIAATHKKD